MRIPYRKRPGWGFACLVATCVACTAAIGWGLRTPALEQVWQLQLELLLGDRAQLSRGERGLLQDTLERYPLMARHMLDDAPRGLISANVGGVVDHGCAYAVRRGPEPAEIVLTSPSGDELAVRVRTARVTVEGLADGAPFVWALPQEGPFPQLIEVSLRTGDSVAQSVRPLRVELRAP